MIIKVVHYLAPDKTENRLREHDPAAPLSELLHAVIGPSASLETHSVSYFAHNSAGVPERTEANRIVIGDESEFQLAVRSLAAARDPPELFVEPRRKTVSGAGSLGGHFLGRMSFGRLGFGPNGTPNEFGEQVREMICSRLAAEDDIAAEVHVHDRHQDAVAAFYSPTPSLASRWTVHTVGLRADRTTGITGSGKALEDIGFGGIDVTFRQTGEADDAGEAGAAEATEDAGEVEDAGATAKSSPPAPSDVSDSDSSLYVAQSVGPGEPYIGRLSLNDSYTVATEGAAASAQERHRSISAGYASSDGAVSYTASGEAADYTTASDAAASYTAASTDASTYTASKGKARVEQLPMASGPYKSPEELGIDVTRFSPLEDLTADHLDDMAVFVDDVTVPDGSVMAPGHEFVKTWLVRNSSTIAWPQGSMLRFVGGDAMDGLCLSSGSEAGLACAPGETVQVSARFTAPAEVMPFISHWRMTTPDGQQFGHRFWVEIVVEQPTSADEVVIDETIVDAYVAMGFLPAAVRAALVASAGDAERALDMLVASQ